MLTSGSVREPCISTKLFAVMVQVYTFQQVTSLFYVIENATCKYVNVRVKMYCMCNSILCDGSVV